MTRDEQRNACIEAMKESARSGQFQIKIGLWSNPDLVALFTAAFNAIHGIAFVNPIEATYEMLVEGDMCPAAAGKWRAMAAAGDLTNTPEKKS